MNQPLWATSASLTMTFNWTLLDRTFDSMKLTFMGRPITISHQVTIMIVVDHLQSSNLYDRPFQVDC